VRDLVKFSISRVVEGNIVTIGTIVNHCRLWLQILRTLIQERNKIVSLTLNIPHLLLLRGASSS